MPSSVIKQSYSFSYFMALKYLDCDIAFNVKSVIFFEFIEISNDYKFEQFSTFKKKSRPLSQIEVSCKSNFFKFLIY